LLELTPLLERKALMPQIPIVELHFSRVEDTVTLIDYALEPKLCVSVPVGAFRTFDAADFRSQGIARIKETLAAYPRAWNNNPGEYQKLSPSKRKAFFEKHRSILVSERSAEEWWLDRMSPVGDGTFVLPIGPEGRVKFDTSTGNNSLIQAINLLLRE